MEMGQLLLVYQCVSLSSWSMGPLVYDFQTIKNIPILLNNIPASYSLWWSMNTDMGSFPWNSSLQTDLNNPQYISLAVLQPEHIICGLNTYFRRHQKRKTDQDRAVLHRSKAHLAGTLGLGMVVRATSVTQMFYFRLPHNYVDKISIFFYHVWAFN